MLFSVIYSVDVPADTRIGPYVPPGRKLWDVTEGDSEYDYGYLEGRWEKGKHRKFCALLTRKQFDRFVQAQGLFAESVETMGSLGAPGCGLGFAPAISFTANDNDAILSAYVTPLPSREGPKSPMTAKRSERNWRRVRRAMLRVYG